jgi:MoaA/NifB/PqqE/SkfB family radical SAM enzyme
MTPKWKINHVQVQTISWCNRSCSFCPSQKLERKLELMSLETYQRVLDELAAIGFSGRFSPYLQGEPLLDKRLPQLVAMASKTLPNAKLLIQSNGDFLKADNGLLLFEAGLHKLIINAYDDDGGRISHLSEIVREIVKKMPDVKFIRGDFRRMIRLEPQRHISREVCIEDKTAWKRDTQDNWAGNVPLIPPLKQPLKKSCFRPFTQLYVQHNGNVVLCCCDWKGEVVFGNLNEASLVEVFSGELATMYRENLARKNRKMKLCELCDFKAKRPITYTLPEPTIIVGLLYIKGMLWINKWLKANR